MTAAIAPPADRPATYTRDGSTATSPMTARVIAAMIAGSPASGPWSAGENQFQ